MITPLIPAYRISIEEIDNLLNFLPNDFSKPSFIVNDVSDNSLEYLKYLRAKKTINFYIIPFQVGKSEVIRFGLKQILKSDNPKIIVQIDGRSKQTCNQTNDHCKKMIDENLDMVISNRYAFQDLSGQPHRVGVTSLFSNIIKYIIPEYNFVDLVCGTRAYTSFLAEKFLFSTSFGYGIEIEEMLICGHNKLRIGEIGVKSNIQHSGTNASKIEDNIFAILNYSHHFNFEDKLKFAISNLLVRVKKRENFEFDMKNLNQTGKLFFEYNHSQMLNAYTSGTDSDGYSVTYADQ